MGYLPRGGALARRHAFLLGFAPLAAELWSPAAEYGG